ncbi:hypothetical protein K7640_03815 [Micromonospora sp. PLK6-60]|uniref:hypothetical protein n=1 Tax=Micromonospora sp. PLK6-60 TaxID=2873383 RepID=UPI001CA6AA39|nr:hypothetical protein [Micromonospora sp. PLK6-60]MBY8870969.1 hypothetical protein [Micromonospora sp. PLK6-60]
MFFGPGELVGCLSRFLEPTSNGRRPARRVAFTALAARDCVEGVLTRHHPSAQRLRDRTEGFDETLGVLASGAATGVGWWWAALPPPPVRPPEVGSAGLSAVVDLIWTACVRAGLAPFDELTFGLPVDGEFAGRLRFDVVTVDPVVIRPWVDLSLVPVEHAYYELLGAAPPEVFTSTASAAVGRLRPVGVHITSRAGTEATAATVSRHVEAFLDVLAGMSGLSSLEELWRSGRHGTSRHGEWRPPLALAVDGRIGEARTALRELVARTARRPHSRAAHENRRFAGWLVDRYLDRAS